MSKTLFLTSSPNGYSPYEEGHAGSPVSERNGLLFRMCKAWPSTPANVLALASDPENIPMNNGMAESYGEMFTAANLPVGEIYVIDGRNREELDERLKNSDVLILSGGHVPTENRFFNELELREKLEDYSGIVIGISAGTMNSADSVYAQPELPGESADPQYERYLTGLGLTTVNILPHYQAIKDNILDGKRLYEDITFADSYGHTFYALEDGSYLYSDYQGEKIFGKAYEIKNGKIRVVCEDEEFIAI